MRYIFSKEKYEKRMKEIKAKVYKYAEKLDGVEVKFEENSEWGTCGIYYISKKWCEVGRTDERNLHEPD